MFLLNISLLCVFIYFINIYIHIYIYNIFLFDITFINSEKTPSFSPEFFDINIEYIKTKYHNVFMNLLHDLEECLFL